jgi:hypothetical protein
LSGFGSTSLVRFGMGGGGAGPEAVDGPPQGVTGRLEERTPG